MRPLRSHIVQGITANMLASSWLVCSGCILPRVSEHLAPAIEASAQTPPVIDTTVSTPSQSDAGTVMGASVAGAGVMSSTQSSAVTNAQAGSVAGVSVPLAGAAGMHTSAGAAAPASTTTATQSDCPDKCGVCSKCDPMLRSCAAAGGQDDPNGCSGTQSCSFVGQCLDVDQEMTRLHHSQRFTRSELGGDTRYRQVVTFAESGRLAEVRALADCTGSFPVITILAVNTDGTPRDEVLSGTSVKFLNQTPHTSDQLQPGTLPQPLSVRSGDRVAIEVFVIGCGVAINPDVTHAGGSLFFNGEKQSGTLVFQALVAR